MGIHELIKISAVAVGVFISYLKIEFRNEFMWLAGNFFVRLFFFEFSVSGWEIEIKRHDKEREFRRNFSAGLKECA